MRRILLALALAATALLIPASSRAEVPPTTLRVLFIGDSLTANLADMPRLRELMGGTSVDYQQFNAGVGGIGTPETTVEAAALINALHPDLVVVSIGTNDDMSGGQAFHYVTPGIGGPTPPVLNFAQRMVATLDRIRAASPTVKILVSINQCTGPAAPAWIRMRDKNNAIYVSAFDMAAGRYRPQIAGFVWLDRIPVSYQSADGFHPGPAGKVKQQEQYYRAFTRVYPGLPVLADDPELTASCN